MKKLLVIGILFWSQFIRAEYSINEYRNQNPEVMAVYLHGVANGFKIANILNKRAKINPLFCPPETLRLGGQNYKDILDQQIKRVNVSEWNSNVIEIELLNGLVYTFPCK